MQLMSALEAVFFRSIFYLFLFLFCPIYLTLYIETDAYICT